jgi:chloramphenicol 3-O-phosphotransferase
MDDRGPVFVISGVVGAGKSTVSDALMSRFSRSIHIPLDDVRSWVVKGYADPTEPWNDETELQFRLAREGAARMARNYSDAGFAVALDDVIWPHEVEELFAPVLTGHDFYRVFLHAPLEVTLQRNATRSNKNFDTAVLEGTIRMLHERVDPEAGHWSGWLIHDTARMTIEETVEAILRCASIEAQYRGLP